MRRKNKITMRFLFPCSSSTSIGSTATIALLVVLRLLQLVSLVVGDPGIEAQEKEYANYGVDVSWPMHHESVARQNLLGYRQGIYNQFMSGCSKYGIIPTTRHLLAWKLSEITSG